MKAPLSAAVLAFAFSLSLSTTAPAQPREVAFELIRLPGGYTGNSITSIVQDHEGFMWFGSWAGVHRYDGHRTTTFAHIPSDSTSLSPGSVLCLYVDRAGILWIGTKGGLNRFNADTETFTRYRHDPGDPFSLSSNTTRAVLEDNLGALWVGTDRGLNRFDRMAGTFTRFMHDPHNATSLSDDVVNTLAEDRMGVLWVGTARGLNRFDRSTETFSRYLHDPTSEASLISNHVEVIYEDSRGTFWVGTDGDGLHTMDRRSGTFVRHRHDPDDPGKLSRPYVESSSNPGGVTSIHEDRSGVIWIGAFGGGINRYDPRTGVVTQLVHDAGDPSSLIEDWVWSIYESRDGTIWVGVLCAGINKAVRSESKFAHFDLDAVVTALYEDAEGILWIGADGRGLLRYDRTTGALKNYHRDWSDATSLVNNVVYAISESRDGALWIGTADGLSRFDRQKETFTWYRHRPNDSNSLSENGIISIHEDREGLLWVGTWLSGLNRLDPESGRITRYRHDPNDPKSLGSDLVQVIYETRDGALWIGTGGGGLNRFDPATQSFTRYRHDPNDPASLSEDAVISIHEDPSGALWVGTATGGLNRLDRDTGRFTHFTPQNLDLADNYIQAILSDDAGNLWIRTEHGLTMFDPATNTFHRYRADPDRPTRPFRYLHPFSAHHRSRSGELFMSEQDGFLAFFPGNIRVQANDRPPQIALTGFRLFDHPVRPSPEGPLHRSLSGSEALVLRHDQNVFSFEFVALHFADPEQNRYTYMLEGYDQEWRQASAARTAGYYKVAPGEYVFRVKAANADGFWNEQGISIRVVVLPPWWATWWFRLLAVSAVLGLAFAGFHLRVRSMQARTRMLEQQVAERTAEIERQKEKVEESKRQLEEQNAKLQAHESRLVTQADRLLELDQMKSRFFANISHEFRTPLTLILGPLQDALDGAYGALDTRLGVHLECMRRNGQHLLHLISQLLDLSKLESGSMKLRCRRADVVSFVRDLVFAFASRAEREQITLQFTASEAGIPAYFDPDKLEKVVTNLLSNAFQFTSSHGKIRVNIERHCEAAGDCVHIIVRDTGRGISAEHVPFIFDRFYQADGSSTRKGEGTGIGLALAKELVELHHGSIRVESEPGFGTSFHVRLPLGEEHLSPEEIADEGVRAVLSGGGAPGSGAPERSVVELPGDKPPQIGRAGYSETDLPEEAPVVLVVEDNADVRDYIRGHLSGLYRAVEAADGVEGLAQARTIHPDLILCDVMMPQMDGYDLCRAIKSDPLLSHTPVILLTARASEESKVEGLEAGADDYLYKPFSMRELLARVENAIHVRRSLRERFSGEVVVRPSDITVTPADAAFLERVRTLVEERMADPDFGVEQLADTVGVSPRHLGRRLCLLTSLSTAEYIRTMRLERAAQLLEQRAGTVAEVAYRVGFRNADHFSKLFREVFEVPPSRYQPERSEPGLS